MAERPLFTRIVLGLFDRIDPDREVIITNPKTGKTIALSESERKTDFILRYKLQSLSQPPTKPD